LVFLEVLPMSLARRGGVPLEERQLDPARLDANEARRLLPYYHQSYRLHGRWSLARLLPIYRHQAELRDVLGLDVDSRLIGSDLTGLDRFGWRGRPGPTNPQDAKHKLQFALGQYDDVFNDVALAQGPVSALRSLLELCRGEGIAAALVIPPESTPFRELYESKPTDLDETIDQIAKAFDVKVYDARSWVNDDGFCDGHHLAINGADAYTRQFEQEVLKPEWERFSTRRRAALER
jgi:hypothetical protein